MSRPFVVRALVSHAPLYLVVGLGGCNMFEPDDAPAPIDWLETRFDGGYMHVRAIGSAGCGRLTGLQTHVYHDGPFAVVHAFGRVTVPDYQCLAPVSFDATVSIETPGTRAGIIVSASRTGDRSDRRDLFTVTSTEHRVVAWVGGTAEVELVGECPHIRLGPGFPPSGTYAIELPRDVELRDGDRVTLSGTLPRATPSLCSPEPLLRVDRLALSFARTR